MEEETGATPASVPPMPPAPPARPRPSRKRAVIVVVVGVVAVAGIASGATAVLLSGSGGDHVDSKPRGAASAPVAAPEEPSEEPTETYNDSPAAEDFSLDFKTTEKQCFGSAGCSLTVEPRLGYIGAVSLDPEKSFSVTYEVRGDESGPVIQTIEATMIEPGKLQSSFTPVTLSTPGRSTKVTMKVTDVSLSG